MNRMFNGVRNDIWELKSTVGGSMNNNFGRILMGSNYFLTIGEIKNEYFKNVFKLLLLLPYPKEKFLIKTILSSIGS